ncbi:MAG TPA: glycosyltransferase family 39 protein, partial [Rhodocyclaceae bacterium]|nr:glycosyltransferase family 39 protein [Rhodocyclaceae bacterium]
AMYFCAFWVFTWFFLRTIRQQDILQWMLLGILLGLAALVKPHAIFLMPALAGLFIVFFRQDRDAGASRKILLYAVFFAVAIATKFGISFLLAGKSGLTLLGTSYTTLASKSMTDSSRYLNLALLVLENLRGHLLGIALLFSVPVAQVLLSLKYFFQKHDEQDASIPLKLYAAAVFTVLLGVVTFFTASVAGSGPFETITRLHMRYYSFAFPLLLLVAASQLSPDAAVTVRKWRTIIALPVGLAIMYAMLMKFAAYTPNFVDSPSLRGVAADPIIFYTLSLLSLVALVAWVSRPGLGAEIFVYIFLPLSLTIPTIYVSQDLEKRHVPDVYDKAGMFASQYLSGEKFPDILVVGKSDNGMLRAMLHLDNPAATMKSIAQIVAMPKPELSKMLSNKKWILAVGNHPLPQGTDFKISLNGFVLAKVPGSNIVIFRNSTWPGVIAKTGGLYPSEKWGTWSAGDVTLEFVKPLPDKFAIHLWAFTQTAYVGKEFVARVGNASRSFKLESTASTEQVLEFENPEGAKTLVIEVPKGADRTHGIALTGLGISPLNVKW